jgi:cytochrome c oxidase assembly protein subunit 15
LIHAGTSLAVLVTVGVAIALIRRHSSELPGLVPPMRVMEITLAVQIVLGIVGWWLLRPFDGIPRDVDMIQALIRTGHQANAALLLASAVTLLVRLVGGSASVPLRSTANCVAQTTARPGTELVVA